MATLCHPLKISRNPSKFSNFSKNGHFGEAILNLRRSTFSQTLNFCEIFGLVSGNLWKSYIGWIRKNPRIQPNYHFCHFLSKIAIIGSKLKLWNFPEFSLTMFWDFSEIFLCGTRWCSVTGKFVRPLSGRNFGMFRSEIILKFYTSAGILILWLFVIFEQF